TKISRIAIKTPAMASIVRPTSWVRMRQASQTFPGRREFVSPTSPSVICRTSPPATKLSKTLGARAPVEHTHSDRSARCTVFILCGGTLPGQRPTGYGIMVHNVLASLYRPDDNRRHDLDLARRICGAGAGIGSHRAADRSLRLRRFPCVDQSHPGYRFGG